MADLVRISNEHLAVEVSTLGAEMQSVKSIDGRSWLWNGDPQFWNGRSPILFPIVGKAPDNTITVDGRPYPINQHGFARRTVFELVEATNSRSRHRLAASPHTREAYPFEFELIVQHEVQGPALTVTAEVTNRDSRPMPFGIGFHPAFAWPLPGAGNEPHRIRLAHDGEPLMRRVEGGLMMKEVQPSPFASGELVLDHSLFEKDAMIFPEVQATSLFYGPPNGPRLGFSFRNLPNIALWSKPEAPFVCIEPWHGTAPEIGATAELVERPYGVLLAPGEAQTFGFSVNFSEAL